jgi:hypothetical protein
VPWPSAAAGGPPGVRVRANFGAAQAEPDARGGFGSPGRERGRRRGAEAQLSPAVACSAAGSAPGALARRTNSAGAGRSGRQVVWRAGTRARASMGPWRLS